MVYGKTGPARAVYCDPDTDPPGQRWFSVFLDDADPWDEETQDWGEPDLAPVCAHCLIEFHPELGRGLDLAVEVKGGVVRDRETGEWWATDDRDLYPEDLE